MGTKEDNEQEKILRFSARRKTAVVLRLLRGEDIDVVSRELEVSPAVLSEWREQFLVHGGAAMKKKQSSSKEVEVDRLHKKLGEMTMTVELLQEKIRRLDPNDPFYVRRSK